MSLNSQSCRKYLVRLVTLNAHQRVLSLLVGSSESLMSIFSGVFLLIISVYFMNSDECCKLKSIQAHLDFLLPST